MELDTLKHFINKDVEVLVGGVWIEGHMTPIVKGIVTLLPVGVSKEFYGPAACHAEVIQAVRQVKLQPQTNQVSVNSNPNPPPAVKSALESIQPGNRFIQK